MNNAHTVAVAKAHDKTKFWKFTRGFANTFKLTCKKPVYCVSHKLSNLVFRDIAHNTNSMTKAALWAAIKHSMHYEHRNLTKENLEWLNANINRDAAEGGNKVTMNEEEFWLFVNQYVHYFKFPCPKD